jgi:hypothetical protein
VAIPATRIGLMDDLDGPAAPPVVAALLVLAFVSCVLAFEWARRRSRDHGP